MPWWSWILLWIALVALSLLFYAFLGFRLFRQIVVTFKELGEAGARLGQFDPSRPGSQDQGPKDQTDAGAGMQIRAPGAAVFASPEQMTHEYHAAKISRREARRQRRVRRKASRGQPQALRDIDFSKT